MALGSLHHHRNYRGFAAGQTVSSIGTWVERFAATWLILDLTQSAVAVGVLALCQFLPFTFFGLFSGALIDRFDPLRLVITTQLLLGSASIALATLTLSGVVTPLEVYAFAAFSGLVAVVDSPGRQALTFEMVGRDGSRRGGRCQHDDLQPRASGRSGRRRRDRRAARHRGLLRRRRRELRPGAHRAAAGAPVRARRRSPPGRRAERAAGHARHRRPTSCGRPRSR